MTSRVTMGGFSEDTGTVEGSEFTFREVLMDAVQSVNSRDFLSEWLKLMPQSLRAHWRRAMVQCLILLSDPVDLQRVCCRGLPADGC